MGVAVILDLNDDVSVPVLKHFLSFVPVDFDYTMDLRDTPELPQFLVIPLPVPTAGD